MDIVDILIKDIGQLNAKEKQQAINYILYLIETKNNQLKNHNRNLLKSEQNYQDTLQEKEEENKLSQQKIKNMELRDWSDMEESSKKKKKAELERRNLGYMKQLAQSEEKKVIHKIKDYVERLKIIIALLKGKNIQYDSLLKHILKEASESIRLECQDIRLMIYMHDNNKQIKKCLKDYEEQPILLKENVLEKIKATLDLYKRNHARINSCSLIDALDYKTVTLENLLNEDAEFLYEFLFLGGKENKQLK